MKVDINVGLTTSNSLNRNAVLHFVTDAGSWISLCQGIMRTSGVQKCCQLKGQFGMANFADLASNNPYPMNKKAGSRTGDVCSLVNK